MAEFVLEKCRRGEDSAKLVQLTLKEILRVAKYDCYSSTSYKQDGLRPYNLFKDYFTPTEKKLSEFLRLE